MSVLRLCLLLLLAAFARGESTPASQPFEEDIRALEASDRLKPPPAGAVFFVGSSSIRLWETLAEDFSGRPVVNRGFGGSHLADCVRAADRLVLPYKPAEVVLYAGDNDIADGRSPRQVLEDFRAFVRKVRSARPDARVLFVSIKPSPARWSLVKGTRKANRLIRKAVRSDPGLAYVDVFTPMLGKDGRPRPELFREDGLHMSREGYALWTRLVKEALDKPRAGTR